MRDNENEFLNSIEDNILRNIRDLHDSPRSLTDLLNERRGYILGFCRAKGWDSQRMKDILGKIDRTLNSLQPSFGADLILTK